ncbi:hypothetical protein OOZ51_09650 [Arthrobacter sp. MI7-26]|nr:hypothetical protein [Arthrobacter sp. MI7-26]
MLHNLSCVLAVHEAAQAKLISIVEVTTGQERGQIRIINRNRTRKTIGQLVYDHLQPARHALTLRLPEFRDPHPRTWVVSQCHLNVSCSQHAQPSDANLRGDYQETVGQPAKHRFEVLDSAYRHRVGAEASLVRASNTHDLTPSLSAAWTRELPPLSGGISDRPPGESSSHERSQVAMRSQPFHVRAA